MNTNESSSVAYDVPEAKKAAARLRTIFLRHGSIAELAHGANALAEVIIAPSIPLTTCSAGCAHCCKQSSIVIDEVDALLLSQVTGRTIDSPGSGQLAEFKGVPCVFLDGITNTCTVYEHRPLTCRVSISVDNPGKCQTEEFRQMVAVEQVYMEMMQLIGIENTTFYNSSRGARAPADIREFFRPK